MPQTDTIRDVLAAVSESIEELSHWERTVGKSFEDWTLDNLEISSDALETGRRFLDHASNALAASHLGDPDRFEEFQKCCNESEKLHYEMGLKESIIERMRLITTRLKRLRWWTAIFQVTCIISICWVVIWSLTGMKDVPLTATAAALGMFFLLVIGYRWCWRDWQQEMKVLRDRMAEVEAKRGPYR